MLVMVDLDGTLVETVKINYFAYKEALRMAGYDLGYEEYARKYDGLTYDVFLKFIDASMAKETIEAIHDFKKQAYKKYMSYGVLNTNLVAMLQAMKSNGWTVALVSSASRKNIDDILRYFELEDLFEYICSKDDVNEPKPSPEGYLNLMCRLGETPKTTVIFEDSNAGIEAAQRSGINYYITRNIYK